MCTIHGNTNNSRFCLQQWQQGELEEFGDCNMQRWNIQNIDIYYSGGKAHCWHCREGQGQSAPWYPLKLTLDSIMCKKERSLEQQNGQKSPLTVPEDAGGLSGSLCLEQSNRYRHFIQFSWTLHKLIIEYQAAASVSDEDLSCNIIAPRERSRWLIFLTAVFLSLLLWKLHKEGWGCENMSRYLFLHSPVAW